jgi:hypothetical protein
MQPCSVERQGLSFVDLRRLHHSATPSFSSHSENLNANAEWKGPAMHRALHATHSVASLVCVAKVSLLKNSDHSLHADMSWAQMLVFGAWKLAMEFG